MTVIENDKYYTECYIECDIECAVCFEFLTCDNEVVLKCCENKIHLECIYNMFVAVKFQEILMFICPFCRNETLYKNVLSLKDIKKFNKKYNKNNYKKLVDKYNGKYNEHSQDEHSQDEYDQYEENYSFSCTKLFLAITLIIIFFVLIYPIFIKK